jgi:glycerophosphoryl diester phosphodiesterase
MEIIAHRGESYTAPENTLAAFALGWSQVDVCELDVWPTADGHLLVCHDENTRRTTGVDRLIGRHTRAELQQLDAGTFKDPRFAGEKLPGLDEVLDAMPAGKRLLIELKSDAAIVPLLKAPLEKSGKLEQIALQSFDYATCRAAKAAFPQFRVSLLSELREVASEGGGVPPWAGLISKAQAANLDGLALEYQATIDGACAQQIHQSGLFLHVWTVDDPALALRLLHIGTDGVITNRPGWLRTQLGF